tara:strand:- start:1574 stop:2017 length:444 start_codon:yes stop_codon:yes gene_type:complete
LGGKGYKPYTSLTGKKVSGDWEDSDRGAGNKATRRSGGSVKAKSPTYLAHVHNKVKKESFSDWRKDLGEEGSDKIKDARLVNYGIGHDGSDKKGSVKRAPETKVKGKTVLQKETEKKYGKGASVMDVVRAKIEKEHGKGAIYDGKKK